MCETQGTNWESTAKTQMSLRLEYQNAIERVRKLHTQTEYGTCCVCAHNSWETEFMDYPCPTIKALDGVE